MDMKKWKPDKMLFRRANGCAERWVTGAMFIDAPGVLYNGDNKDIAQYTLQSDHLYKDGKFYPSLKKLYLEESDPTEYQFYTKWLGGKEHWEACQEGLVFNNMIKKWREELEIKLRSEAVVGLGEMAKAGMYAANLFFAKGGWKVTPTTHTGGGATKRERERADRINKAIAGSGESADVIRLFPERRKVG